jgi:hypothetical protein
VESSHSNPRAFSIPRIFDIEFRNRIDSALYVYSRRGPTPAIFRGQIHELATETDTKIVNC